MVAQGLQQIQRAFQWFQLSINVLKLIASYDAKQCHEFNVPMFILAVCRCFISYPPVWSVLQSLLRIVSELQVDFIVYLISIEAVLIFFRNQYSTSLPSRMVIAPSSMSKMKTLLYAISRFFFTDACQLSIFVCCFYDLAFTVVAGILYNLL